MKRTVDPLSFWLLVIGLCAVVTGFVPVRLSALPPQGIVRAPDSLAILDSLVNQFKILDDKLAIRYANQALAIAQSSGDPEKLTEACILLGISHFQNQKDSSFYFYNLAANYADEAGLEKQKVIIFYNLAALYKISFDYQRAITLLDSSVNLAKSLDDFLGISNGYNMLGLISVKIHDYESARKNFSSALKVAREHKLNEQIGVALGNLASSEFEQDQKKSATMQAEALFYLSQGKGTEEEIANILINIGNRQSNPDSAITYYKAALQLAENTHLPTIIIGASNNMAYSYLEKGDLTSAEMCVRDQAIPIALKYKDSDWLSSLYDTYADVCISKGDLKTALEMQKKALKERISDYKNKGAEQVRLLAAVLDLKNKELKIQQDEKNLLIKNNQLQRTELWLALTAMLVIVTVFIMLFLQHKNRVKFHKEKINSARRIIEMEENEKGRIARELHDLTGQLVLGISGMIENLEFTDQSLKQSIHDRIKELGGSIRHISHRMNKAMIEHFTFSELITGHCMDVKKLLGLNIELQIPEYLPELPNEMVLHFYRILQELLTNAGKYARNAPIRIVITLSNDQLMMFYEDRGPGFDNTGTKKTGMGFSNIFERVKLVNGQATVRSEPGMGTRWDFSFPVGSKN